MNGTERYFNSRIQDGVGVTLVEYDANTSEVTASAPFIVLQSQRSTDQTITPVGQTILTDQTIVADTGAFVSLSGNGVWTCVEPGCYFVYCSARVNFGATSTNVARMMIRHNGVAVSRSELAIGMSDNTSNSSSVTSPYFYDVGDTLDIFVSSAFNYVIGRCDLFVTRI